MANTTQAGVSGAGGTPGSIPVSTRHGLPLMRDMRRDPLGTFTALSREHGPVVRIRVPGPPLYLVTDPDLIQEALTRTHHGYDKGVPRRGDPDAPGDQPLALVLGQGLLTSAADLHRRQRRLIQPVFHHDRIEGYTRTFVELAERAAANWTPGEPRDVHRDATDLTLAIIVATVFAGDLDARTVVMIRDSVARSQSALRVSTLPFARLIMRLPLPVNRRWRRARADLDSIVYRLIAARRAAGATGSDVLSLLLTTRDADTGEPMPDVRVRDEATTLLLAGHETTANGVAWALHLLAGEPAVQERARDELRGVLGGRPPELADLPALPYTGAVWRETLRLYPPAWAVVRRVTGQHTGVPPVAPGSVLILPAWVVHRDPRWWPGPERFDPGRWLSAEQAARPRYAYFPFGGGPRQCIGNEFADLEGTLILASLLRSWRFTQAPDAPPVVPQPLVTLRPGNGVRLVPERV